MKQSFCRKTIAIVTSLIFLQACTSKSILRDSDYHDSVEDFRYGRIENSLSSFPDKEKGGFVTTLEKSWLGLWNEKEDKKLLKSLEKQSLTFDDRKYVSITREAKTFLLEESEEGYIPSEPEVISLHLVAAMNYMQLKQWEEAKVEARLAGFYLQNTVDVEKSHFDDPALRLWLAGIWAGLGDWEAAQVDLRVAAKLSHNKKLEKLAEGKVPQEMTITFHGVAPTIKWKKGEHTPEFIRSEVRPKNEISFNTHPWFLRHLERNTELRDLIIKSNYMSQYFEVETVVVGKRTMARTSAIVVGTLGIFLGIGIAAAPLLPAAGLTGEAAAAAVGLGFLIGIGSYALAKEMDHTIQSRIDQSEEEELQQMRTYRLVRFLPEWISLETDQLASSIGNPSVILDLSKPGSQTQVLFVQEFEEFSNSGVKP